MTAYQYRMWKFKRVVGIQARGILIILLLASLILFWLSKPPQKLTVDAKVIEVQGKFPVCECKPSETPKPTPKPKDTRSEEIKTYLQKYKSPMAGYAQVFVKQADKYKVDPKLLVALAIVESSGGKNSCAKYNAFSIMQWNKGKRSCRVFKSYEESIAYTAWLMGEYKKGGHVTVKSIGTHYNPGSSKWVKDVTLVMSRI